MAAASQKILPQAGVDVDVAELYIEEIKAAFLKNISNERSDNIRASLKEGENEYNFMPIESNSTYCNITLPTGTNYCCGFKYFKEINQGFVCVWNSANNHMIYRIRGNDGVCEKVIIRPCLNFQLHPENFIGEGRMSIGSTCRYNKVLDTQETVTFLIIVDNYNPQWMIAVEDAIATSGFDGVTWPFFNVNDTDCSACSPISLGLSQNMDCIIITPQKRDLVTLLTVDFQTQLVGNYFLIVGQPDIFKYFVVGNDIVVSNTTSNNKTFTVIGITGTEDSFQLHLAGAVALETVVGGHILVEDNAEILKQNLLNYKTWQFRIKYYDVWGRPSEHGVISEMYVNTVGSTCLSESKGIPRCLSLKFKAGCPIVDKIQIEFRNCLGNIRGLSVSTDWYQYDLIDKYDNSQVQNWWQRSINNAPGWTYDASDNTIEYIFCGDKECKPNDVNETNRSYNYLPLVSGSVFGLNKGIGLARNVRDFEPLDISQLTKMKFSVEKPSSSLSCAKVKRKITVYGVIVNAHNEGPVRLRKLQNNIVFGNRDQQVVQFGQVLPKGQEGIIAYLAGTPYYAISKQYKYTRGTKEMVYIGLEDFDTSLQLEYGIQKWEFEVPPGKYVLRLASHKATPTDNYKATSTYLIGRSSLGSDGTAIPSRDPIFGEEKELIIDTCFSDFTSFDTTPLMIWDLTKSNGSIAVDGYLMEDEIGRIPIELAQLNTPYYALETRETDHNGFYFSTTTHAENTAALSSRKNCSFVQVATGRTTSAINGPGYVSDNLFVYKNADKFLDKDRVIVKGKIVLCDDSTIGVPGALVILTRGGYAYTDINGEFRIIAHDEQDFSTRSDAIIYSQSGGCEIIACGTGCVRCFTDQNIVIPTCDGNARLYTLASVLQVQVFGIDKKGPTMGGRYAIGIVLHDVIGRQTFVQFMDKHYISIPSLQETGVYDYSKILFDITGMTFPAWVKRISFFTSENLNIDDYLTWVAERVQYVDNTGRVNTAAPTQIRLYYESLNEYNKQNNFSTNSVWQFLISSTENVIIGDEVEFIADANGNFFPQIISSLVKYDKTGAYIAVDYIPELANLTDGILIRLKRAKTCTDKNFFYELCPMIPVSDGVPAVVTGQLNFFDSYLLNRQIPVPVLTTVTTTDSDNNEIQTSVSVNELKNYPFLFEHHSPSDFWGDHCWNRGRVSVRNKLENQQCRKTEICVSDTLNLDGIINGLGTFSESDTIVFNESDWGGITACLADLNDILVICENGSFLTIYNDTTVQVNSVGQVVAPAGENRFSRPQITSPFGCQIQDVNTVRRSKKNVVFLDGINTALLLHDFRSVVDISNNGAKSIITSYIKSLMASRNAGGSIKYFHGAIDPKTNNYLLSISKLNQVDADYINDSGEFISGSNETLVFNLDSKTFKGNRSFIPEYFGYMDGEINDQQLISFRYGKPWIHHILNSNTTSFCNFFGTQCTPWIEVVFNKDNSKIKSYKGVEWYCRQVLFYADRVLTDTGQVSRIMPLWWRKADKFWQADFKCDVNTVPDTNLVKETGVNALLDGDSLYGKWIKVRLRPKNADRGKYFEFTGIIGFMTGSEKSGTD